MVNCCVPFCTSSSRNKDKKNCFHEFPSNMDLRSEWLKVISRKDFEINAKSPSSLVCSKHFKDEDYVPGIKVKRLKKNVVPSLFDKYPAYKVHKKSNSRRKLDRKRSISEENKHDNAEIKRVKIHFENSEETLDPNMSSNAVTPKSSYIDYESPCEFTDCSNKIQDDSRKFNYFKSTLKKKQTEIKLLRSTLWKNNALIEKLRNELRNVQKKLDYYEKSNQHSSLEKLIILQYLLIRY